VNAAVLEFRTTPAIDATMLFGNSILSGIRIDGREIAFGTSVRTSRRRGLAALFAQRDTWAPEAQARLDGVARDLSNGSRRRASIRRFLPTMRGLFTDGGTQRPGSWNRGFPPASWSTPPCVRRMAAPCGACATASAPHRGRDRERHAACGAGRRLSQTRVTAPGRFTATARRWPTWCPIISRPSGLRGRATEAEVSAAVQSALRQQELSRGVDTDAEMQNLIRIEQMYAANARVVQAAEAMLDELMRMTR
jgi:flagellar hook-associated protein 1 FlgK